MKIHETFLAIQFKHVCSMYSVMEMSVTHIEKKLDISSYPQKQSTAKEVNAHSYALVIMLFSIDNRT